MAWLLLDVIIAYVLDLILGDPYSLPHPVRFVGWLVKRTERVLRTFTGGAGRDAARTAKRERIAGTVLMVFVVAVTFLLVFGILKLLSLVHPVLFHIGNIYFIYTSLAGKCLADEAKKVYAVLKAGDLPEARKRLAMLVGRETEHLSESEVTRGVIETTAENTVDGILSPMLYAIAGSFFGLGAPVAYAFKAISTLDSMVGYMNDRYLHFGRTSAKTDDAANYIPARLSGLIIPAAAFFCRLNARKSFTIMLRDRRNHKSPNCAYPEAAFAGALGIRIGGTNVYFGKLVEKPTIGDPDKEMGAEDIMRSVRLMYASSALTLLIGLAVSTVLCLSLGVL